MGIVSPVGIGESFDSGAGVVAAVEKPVVEGASEVSKNALDGAPMLL